MSNFINTIDKMEDETVTKNGCRAFKTSGGGAVLDLFGIISSLRDNPDKAVRMWNAAREEDKELADNLILYTRDIRNGGIGERNLGRVLLAELAKKDPAKVSRNLQTIVNVGRWDDLFVLFDTPIENVVMAFIKEQWKKDIVDMSENKPISLLAKWLPSINTSSEKTKKLARKISHFLGLNERAYRKLLSNMRRYIDIVEKKMSARDWDSINFEGVPSKAMLKYQNAFANHCEKFAEYKENLAKGKAKINASTLYPYDICQKFFMSGISDVDEAMWKAFPNFIDENFSVLIMADVSGSMSFDNFRPMATSIGLATYFAQHNKGAYHNHYLTFTDNPSFIKINDRDSLSDIFNMVCTKGVGYSTDLDKAFEAIYNVAYKSKESPDALVVVSDDEINAYVNHETDTIIERWTEKFELSGLKMPKVIFWNVSRYSSGNYLAKACENVSYVSGYGIGPFKHLKQLIEKNAYEAMVEILTKPEFSWA